MTRRLGLAVFFLLAGLRTCTANPVPYGTMKDFQDLVATTASQGRCPNPSRLASYFGDLGFDLLPPSVRQSIEDHFDLFAPILVTSQLPGHGPRFDIQRLYRSHANAPQKQAMIKALRAWFTARITEAPFEGSMRIDGPPSAVQTVIARARANAAEMLSDWGDQGALPLMRALAVADSEYPDLRWHLRRSQEHMSNPCAMTFLRLNPDSSLNCCLSRADVAEATIVGGGWSRGTVEYALADSELQSLWPLIGTARITRNTGWGGRGYSIVLDFKNGVRASLNPTGPGHVTYEDNTSLELGPAITLQSDALRQNIWSLFQRHLGDRLR